MAQPGSRPDSRLRDGNPIGPWPVALQLLGAVAGITALTTFVGGAMLWIRFEELQLPADQAVNLLPKPLLLVVGSHSLAAPVCLGLLSALVFVIINPYERGQPRRVAYPLTTSMIVLAGSAIAAARVRGFDAFPEQAIMVASLVVGIAAVFTVAGVGGGRFQMAWTLFAAFLLCGAALAIVRTMGSPAMEPIAVTLTDRGQSVAGFYVGQTSDRLYLAPLPGTGDPGDPFADAEIDRLIEIDRDQIEQMAFREPTGVRSDEGGREQAQSLLEDLRVAAAGGNLPAADEQITTADPITAFAPLVHLHAKEQLWPISADAFLRNSVLLWSHGRNCDAWNPETGTHTDDPSRGGELIGGFQREKLSGSDAYTHGPSSPDCEDNEGRVVSAAAHTRPFDAKGRAPGVPLTEGFALDLRNDKRSGTKQVEPDGAQLVLKNAPVYFQRTVGQGPNGERVLRVTYWLFYALSRPPKAPAGVVDHEGDWERISVLLALGKGKDDYRPLSVRYHAHDGHRDVTWSAVKRVGTGGAEPSTHPVVFSAIGSHASYWRAGSYENVFKVGTRRIFAVRDQAIACPLCAQWRTWERLHDATAQPWFGFGGAWGAPGKMAGTTGPLGPSKYKTEGLSPAPEKTTELAPIPSAPAPAPSATPTPTSTD